MQNDDPDFHALQVLDLATRITKAINARISQDSEHLMLWHVGAALAQVSGDFARKLSEKERECFMDHFTMVLSNSDDVVKTSDIIQ